MKAIAHHQLHLSKIIALMLRSQSESERKRKSFFLIFDVALFEQFQKQCNPFVRDIAFVFA